MDNSSYSDIGSLKNKVALITGGSSGLGRAIALAYAAAGAYIVSADLKEEPPHAPLLSSTLQKTDLHTPTVKLVNSQHSGEDKKPRASFVRCDVTSADDVAAAVAFTAKTYGRLDIMVNNAGVALEAGKQTRIHETDPSILDTDWAVNGRGVWLGCKYAAAQMLEQPPHSSGDRGWIINMSSMLGYVGMAGVSCYCATKGAVIQMTKAVALEYASDRIHVNCINPGFTETNMLEPMRMEQGVAQFTETLTSIHPWGRLGLPDNIAKMAVFLAGEGAGWITGQSFVVDGGYTAQ